MSTQLRAALYIPPRPSYSAEQPSLRQFLRTMRTNALLLWPEAAYERPFMVNRRLGRTRILINAPDAIHRVLVENSGNYGRTAASTRILRPVVGDGLVLSEGHDWRHQRRTIAPAIAPRVIPVLTRHIGAVADETVASLRSRSHASVNLLDEMQFAALEIAGRSMFSLEMGDFGPARLRPLAIPASLDGVHRPHHRRATGVGCSWGAARPVRLASLGARPRDGRRFHPRAVARPGRDNDCRRSCDHRDFAILVALSARECDRLAGCHRRRSLRSRPRNGGRR